MTNHEKFTYLRNKIINGTATRKDVFELERVRKDWEKDFLEILKERK